MQQTENLRNVGIAPDPDAARGFFGCQCELGREKLLTAPPYRTGDREDATDSRTLTAPGGRGNQPVKNPLSHITVTFRSPLHPGEAYSKLFPAGTPVKYLKRKLAKLLSVANSNLILAKNRTILKDATLLSDVRTNAMGNTVIDVFTKDSCDFSLSSIPKEAYVLDLLNSVIPKKPPIAFIAVKFKIRDQNQSFTRSYHSIMRIQEIKKNLAGLFRVDHENIVLLRGENPLMDRMVLHDIDYDKFGNVDVELIMRGGEKLDLDKLYKELPMNDVLTVSVPLGHTTKHINVEIFFEPIDKPYLGGYKNIYTGTVYHHAYTQTGPKAEKVLPENKRSRVTQTAEEKERLFDTAYSRATQMGSVSVYIPTVTDRIVAPRPYETYDEMVQRLNHDHYATVIQRAYRNYVFRKKVANWIKLCLERIARLKEQDRLEREAMEKRLRRDLITHTFPRTREDFDQLYAMVDRWKHAEIARISSLHSKGPKIAEFTLLLDKEVELLRCIEAYRIKVKEDDKKLKEKSFLEEISKPIVWYGKDGKIITMETVEIQKARKLKELYNSFIREDMETKERLELLVEMKFALQSFHHPLAENIITLLDQEADLIVRRCSVHQLEYLRRRIAGNIFQFIKNSELNSGVTKCKDLRQIRKMQHDRLQFCEMCSHVKHYTEFPLHTKMSGFIVCQSCSWKDVGERIWVDMTPYKFILRAVQRDERRRKCWGSVAFVLQEKDVFFIVEKLWHAHSAISEVSDITELRLCRWDVKEDWSPWNCFLVTVSEMKAHLKLEDPELVYDEELVTKIKNKHKLARANFEHLLAVDKRFTESGDWHGVRATAVDRTGGVEPCCGNE
ncbi:IQ and ubiquitin-like domain-containing protein [Plutella xylostella]|uniref:IQ and ubiquitin-like domain-containing protein n=1 Tax=Plutella xylostella TaxID=51655 RepID=UPI0020329512|nr:IQ and ubiquitin-like domain-containing protein [Plutella xylostella]